MPRVFSEADFEPAQPSGGRVFSEADFADSTPEGEPSGALRTGILSAANSAPFAKQIGAAFRTAGKFVQNPYGDVDPVETYRQERDAITAGYERDVAENPTASTVGTVVGVTGQVLSGGVNPVNVVKNIGSGARSLFSREGVQGIYAAGRQLLTREGASTAATELGKAGLTGAAVGGSYALSESKADLTKGELGEAAADTLEGAEQGALFGLGARALLGVPAAAQAGRVAAGEERVAAAVAKERDQAVRLTGLDGKQKTLGGPARAKARAQALYDEPSPQDPRKTLLQQVEGATPDARLEYATELRRQVGQELGAIRDQLAKVPAGLSVQAVKQQLRGAFADLPTEVQAKALEQLDGMIGALAKDGKIAPAALRKLIEDTEGLAKFGTPNLEAALGNARARVFQAARGVLVQNERDLIAIALPERAEAYTEALRKYGVYSDFEMGSKVILERANKGQKLIRQPVVEPKERGVRGQLLRLTIGEDRARAAETIMQLWGRWTQPTVAATSAKLKKIERLQPMMEEALSKGPAEVARLHALFLARSPDYRKAIESE